MIEKDLNININIWPGKDTLRLPKLIIYMALFGKARLAVYVFLLPSNFHWHFSDFRADAFDFKFMKILVELRISGCILKSIVK